MNIFRLFGDLTHLMSRILLVANIHGSKNCGDFSAKTQCLYLLVFLSGFTDVFNHFVSYYNTILKIIYPIICGCTIVLMLMPYRETYQKSQDTFKLKFLLPIIFGLALIFNYEFAAQELLWTFSIYLEAVAMLPQMFMIFRLGKADRFTLLYMLMVALYRLFYIFNWIYRYKNEGFYDNISHVGGSAQVIFNILFFTYYFVFRRPPFSDDLEQDLLSNETNESVLLERPPQNIRASKDLEEVHGETPSGGYGTFGKDHTKSENHLLQEGARQASE